nr:hypothetical protein [Acetobacter pasteurianus]
MGNYERISVFKPSCRGVIFGGLQKFLWCQWMLWIWGKFCMTKCVCFPKAASIVNHVPDHQGRAVERQNQLVFFALQQVVRGRGRV